MKTLNQFAKREIQKKSVSAFYEPWLCAKYQKKEQPILSLFNRNYTEIAATFTEKNS